MDLAFLHRHSIHLPCARAISICTMDIIQWTCCIKLQWVRVGLTWAMLDPVMTLCIYIALLLSKSFQIYHPSHFISSTPFWRGKACFLPSLSNWRNHVQHHSVPHLYPVGVTGPPSGPTAQWNWGDNRWMESSCSFWTLQLLPSFHLLSTLPPGISLPLLSETCPSVLTATTLRSCRDLKVSNLIMQ